MSSDLVAFVEARLTDDERIALSAKGWSGIWTTGTNDSFPGTVEDTTGGIVVYDEGSPSAMQAQHIARHDPARALRGLEFQRGLVTTYRHALLQQAPEAALLEHVLRGLAWTWSDHPDYRAEWAP